ncbi:ABC transporter ATP-binding protein [Rickettsia endosymbiont of Polydrusus tereticollis]|uniref:ABC transporter ATP-binding protein n=2 Tax=Rickettsia endosymbiont of Polydrusus tereticollis TaxID=3066251 RepID=UPI003132CD44
MSKSTFHDLKNVLLFILKILPQFKLNIVIMFLVSLMWAIDLSLRKYVIKDILDIAVKYQGGSIIEHLFLPISIYIFMGLFITTIFRLYGYFVDIKMVPLLKGKIADRAFYMLLNQSHSYFLNNFSGDLTHKVNNLIDSTIELIKLIIDRFFAYSLALIFAIYILSLANIKFAIATLIWVIIFILVSILCFRKLSNLANCYSSSGTKATANLTDSLSNITIIRLFTKQTYKRLKFLRIYKEKIDTEKKMQRAYFWIWFIYGYSFELLQAISLYFLIYGYQSGEVELGDIALVLGINIAIVEFLNQLTGYMTQFSTHFGKVSDALSSINTKLEITNKENATTLEVNKGEIKFKQVLFCYPNKKPLFKDFSVTINPKEKIGLVGHSGSGKSTFINLILRLFEVKEGTIQIDNQFITDVTQNSLRQKIAVVPQDLMLFHDTILENIRYGGNNETTEQAVVQAAKFSGIHKFINGLPKGYYTIVGEKGLKLSGGERQRIIIARVFLKNTPILLLDEATNQLDSVTEKEIQESLFKLMEHKTTIVIAHRLSTLLHMNRILVFDNGTIVQDGSHSELVIQKGLYQDIWNTQTDDILRY